MKARYRKLLLWIVGILILVLGGVLLVERMLERRVEASLGDQAEVALVDISLVLNRMELRGFSLKLDEVQVEADAINLSGFKIFPWLLRDEIQVKNLEVANMQFTHWSDRTDTIAAASLDYRIGVDAFSLMNAQVQVLSPDEESLSGVVSKLVLEGVELDQESLQAPIPFRYDRYFLQVDSLKSTLDPRHELRLSRLTSDNGALLAQNLAVIPLYDRETFQQHIDHELDRYDLRVAGVAMDSLGIDFPGDTLKITSPLLRIDRADLEVYRDKLQPDDPSKKLLYSAQIRKLPIHLEVHKMEVVDSRIVYLERVHKEREPLQVVFSEVGGMVWNLSNFSAGKALDDTRVKVEARFMESAPLQVDWSFNVEDPMDHFRISGSFTGLPSEGINRFLTPAMNLKANGGISYLAFNFQGNDHQATGEMRLEYQDFSVDVLKKDGSEKRGLFTAIANIFVSSKAEGKDTELMDLEVTRDKSKSFWNFLWLCLKEGALESFL